ncbi:MAG: NADH-quinone oxidoreductase subunit H, partial [Myxococcales bacterium]|nr:NADH-quinone oxidoreductase subunit H [Myxococcales bacterium]
MEDIGFLLGTTAAKIGFMIGVGVAAFAPILVWAERRQSAMIQDRVGPHRAGIPLPAAPMRMLRAWLDAAFWPLGAVAAIAAIFLIWGLFLRGPSGGHGAYLLIPILSFLAVGGVRTYVHRLTDGRGVIALGGLLHPIADAMKMIFKEDFVPPKADKLLHGLAPIISLIPAVAAFAVIPIADVLYLDYWDQVLLPGEVFDFASASAVPMQIAPIDIGILFIFAIAGTGVIGAAIAGYSSDNKYSLLGGVRAASQMVSYEVALGLTLVPCFMIYGSLRLEEMAAWQAESGWLGLSWWGIAVPPLTLAFILYMVAAIAENKRIPFDLPEGESELVGGYFTEYSGMKFGMFFMGEFVEVVVLAMLATVFFFGGWDIPFLEAYGFNLPGEWAFELGSVTIGDTLPLWHGVVIGLQVVGFLVKVMALMWLQLMIRWTLPRFRYDQVMAVCWKGLLPLSLFNILFTGICILL